MKNYYEDLIDRLRNTAKVSSALSVFFPNTNGNAMTDLLNEAAEAIEQLKGDD